MLVQVLTMLARSVLAGLMMAALLAGGGFFFYLLYRLTKFLRTPREQRLLERAKKKTAQAHPLASVSGRGRTAWLILCLESALTHFGQTAEDWGWVLGELWALTKAPAESFRPLFRVCQLLPVNILPYDRAEDIYADPLYEALADLWDGERVVTEEDFLLLRALYVQCGWRLCVLEPLLQAIFKTAAASWVPEPNGASEALVTDLLQQAEALLRGWDIPLPEDSAPQGAAFLRTKTSRGWGPPFDGAAWSGFLGKEEGRISRREGP